MDSGHQRCQGMTFFFLLLPPLLSRQWATNKNRHFTQPLCLLINTLKLGNLLKTGTFPPLFLVTPWLCTSSIHCVLLPVPHIRTQGAPQPCSSAFPFPLEKGAGLCWWEGGRVRCSGMSVLVLPWSLPPSIHALALEDSKTCESDICWERTCLDVHPFRTIFPTFSVPFLSHQDLFVPKIFPVVSPETKSAFSERILSLVEANSVSWELALSLSSSTLFLGE